MARNESELGKVEPGNASVCMYCSARAISGFVYICDKKSAELRALMTGRKNHYADLCPLEDNAQKKADLHDQVRQQLRKK